MSLFIQKIPEDKSKSSSFTVPPINTSEARWQAHSANMVDPYEFSFFPGLQTYLQEKVDQISFSDEDLKSAKENFLKVGEEHEFPESKWAHLLNSHGGKLPLRIEVNSIQNPLGAKNINFKIHVTDPKCAWILNDIEGLILNKIWSEFQKSNPIASNPVFQIQPLYSMLSGTSLVSSNKVLSLPVAPDFWMSWFSWLSWSQAMKSQLTWQQRSSLWYIKDHFFRADPSILQHQIGGTIMNLLYYGIFIDPKEHYWDSLKEKSDNDDEEEEELAVEKSNDPTIKIAEKVGEEALEVAKAA